MCVGLAAVCIKFLTIYINRLKFFNIFLFIFKLLL